MKVSIEKLENFLGKKIKRNFTSIGFDWATRAGISFIKTTEDNINIDYIFIEFKDAGSVKSKYKVMVKTLENLLNEQDLAVIEDIFIGFNRKGSLELAKYHAFAIAECIKKNIDYDLISATQCRAFLGIKTTKKAGYGKGKSKQAVHDWIKNVLGFELDDEDASDAVILGLRGVIK